MIINRRPPEEAPFSRNFLPHLPLLRGARQITPVSVSLTGRAESRQYYQWHEDTSDLVW